MSLSVWEALGSNPTNGSSNINNLGLWINADIIANFCFIPWEYEEIKSPRYLVSSNLSP